MTAFGIINEHVQDQATDYRNLKSLAAGGSGVIYAIEEGKMLKEFPGEGIDVKRQALQRLGPHNSLIPERVRTVRSVIQESKGNEIPLHTKVRWLHDAGEGTRHMHDHGIIHADIGCRDWIVVRERVKIIDFDGCSVDGEDAGAWYEWFSYRESCHPISWKTDVFAFGCGIYEVLYAEDQFPEVEDIPLGTMMRGCWDGAFVSMDELVEELQASSLATRKVKSCH
ncbi:hypothetical protein BDW02DRAFT_640062 [Decorospora gaudefroyi]|uniref:Serine-threonine/tyrosine-protein kinase catalytic domain-containing protein n=1 Tax=Decorospora gaudefroyi TaxID=184978 RepID=A0A6A5KG60_9PLEO|nr:hypothetical protein BDW02DRAFT_640062 [Decorospora gaudefroyi]